VSDGAKQNPVMTQMHACQISDLYFVMPNKCTVVCLFFAQKITNWIVTEFVMFGRVHMLNSQRAFSDKVCWLISNQALRAVC
jgi:hypothetical protein